MDIGFLSLQRISSVFNTPVEQLRPEWAFGVDLKSSFRSDFTRNEFDVINDDIHDVADRDALRLLDEGRLVIFTVGEYCDFMIKMGRENGRAVGDVLRSETGIRKESSD